MKWLFVIGSFALLGYVLLHKPRRFRLVSAKVTDQKGNVIYSSSRYGKKVFN